MAAINFPANPNTGNTHSEAGKTWKWDGTSWILQSTTSSGGGSTTFTGLTDTPNSLTAGKWLKVNSGGTALEWTDEPSGGGGGIALTDLSVITDPASGGGALSYNQSTGLFSFAPADLSNFVTSNTTYTQSIVAGSGSGQTSVQWDLTPDVGVADSITITGGTNITFSSTTINGFTIDGPDLTGYALSNHIHSLNDLSNVSASSPTDGYVLKWDGTNSQWIAAPDNATTGGSGTGGGKVVGYESVNSTTTVPFDPDTWTDTGLEITYTPQSTASKIILTSYLNIRGKSPSDSAVTSRGDAYIRILEGSNVVGEQQYLNWGLAHSSTYQHYVTEKEWQFTQHQEYTNGSTNPKTFKVQLYEETGELTLNSSSGQSFFTVMEIADAASGGSGGVDLTAFSVTQNSPGTAALTYNNTNGVFTYTPPDLSAVGGNQNLQEVTDVGKVTTNDITAAGFTSDGDIVIDYDASSSNSEGDIKFLGPSGTTKLHFTSKSQTVAGAASSPTWISTIDTGSLNGGLIINGSKGEYAGGAALVLGYNGGTGLGNEIKYITGLDDDYGYLTNIYGGGVKTVTVGANDVDIAGTLDVTGNFAVSSILPNKFTVNSSNGNTNIAGTLNVDGQFTNSGLNYPLVDGSPGQVLGTDGNGSITFINQQGGGGTGDFTAIGTIAMWSGSIANIPTGWILCDGQTHTVNGSPVTPPDLRNKFIIGAGSTYSVGQTGGSANATLVSHSHGSGSLGTNTTGSHQHTVNKQLWLGLHGTGGTAYIGDSAGVGGGSNVTVTANGNHSHSVNSGSTSTEGSSATNANLPPYYALCYIYKASASASGQGEMNVQSDWNQNDSTHDAYIQNKPNVSDMMNVQSDWNETDTSSHAYIQNKPNIGTGFLLENDTTSTTIQRTGSGSFLTINTDNYFHVYADDHLQFESTTSYFKVDVAGRVQLLSDSYFEACSTYVRFKDETESNTVFECRSDGATYLYYNKNWRLETVDEGIKIQGSIVDVNGSTGTSGQVLSSSVDGNGNAVLDWVDVSGTGTVTQISTGTGLTGGPITTTGTISLDTVGINPQAYTAPSSITVDSYGRITSITEGTVGATQLNDLSDVSLSSPSTDEILKYNGSNWVNSTLTASGGTVTQISTGTGLTGGPITTTGTISLDTTGVNPTTYTTPSSITVDSYGRITGIVSGTAGATQLNELTDVTLSSPVQDQVLTYNGSQWVNSAAQGGTTLTADEQTIQIVNNVISRKGRFHLAQYGYSATHTIRADVTGWLVIITAGGGGAGTAHGGSSSAGSSGGGGGGGSVIYFYDRDEMGTGSMSFTIGNAGSLGSGANSNGGAGGASYFYVGSGGTGPNLSAHGGSGSASASGFGQVGGAGANGGWVTNGAVSRGHDGMDGKASGGASFAGEAGISLPGPGTAGANWGRGARGAASNNGNWNQSPTQGLPGMVVIYEF